MRVDGVLGNAKGRKENIRAAKVIKGGGTATRAGLGHEIEEPY
jgi:hypothetical protein